MAVLSLGTWALDTQTGQVSRKKSNKKKGLLEFQTRTSAQRKSRRAKAKADARRRSEEAGRLRTAKAEARQKAKFEKAKAKAAQNAGFKDRQEARAEQSQPTVTVTGVKSSRPSQSTWRHGRTIPGEVVGPAAQTALPAASKCGQKTADGTPCQRLGSCPQSTHKNARPRSRQKASA